MLFPRFALIAAAALVSVSAHAETSAALIVDISGATSGPAAYTEVQPGTTIQLGTGSMKFVHYQTCKEVEVAGGTITVNTGDFKIEGGKLLSQTSQPCPQQVKMAQTTAVAGGLVMRGVIKMTEVADRPSLVIVGKRASSISSVVFFDEQTRVAELPVNDNRVEWGTKSPALKQGANYKLILQSRDGKAQMEVPVRANEPAKTGVVVLRVD